MTPIVRIATLNDLPTLLEFEQGVIKAERPFDPTIKEEQITYYSIPDLIQNQESEIFVAEIDNKIVSCGYALVKKDRHYLKHTNQGYLGFMFVHEEYRGNRLNKLIVENLLQWCKSRRIYEIKLDVYNDNLSAIKAYEKVGFKKHMISMRLELKENNL